jgi:hypothetical protein
MKVIRYKEEPREHSSLKNNEIVGVEFQSGTKSFVRKIREGQFVCISFTPDNIGESKITGISITNLIDELVNVKNVIVFDSFADLKEWIL